MFETLSEFSDDLLQSGLVAALFSIAGFTLAFFLVARLMGEKRAPANTFAWLLVIVLVPWVGVPLYLLLGGRKLRRVAARKRVRPALPPGVALAAATCDSPTAHTVAFAGGPVPVAGNAVRLLTTGEDAYAALEHHIRSARSHIHITAFILGRDDTGRRLVKLLANRAAEGVRVRLLLDAVGSMFSSGLFVRPLRRSGGEVGVFMPVFPFIGSRGSANLRNHRKIAVFDHCTAIVGGHNLAREYMGPKYHPRRWQDFGAVVSGPAAALLNDVFISDWCFATHASPDVLQREIPLDRIAENQGRAELQVVASGPDVPGDPLYEGIISMIQEARESIWIVTPYFIPDDVLLRSLIVKARAGRKVTLITPRRSDHPVVDFARRHYLRELQRAGGCVLFYGPGMLHSKAMIVDDTVALFGSANFDLRSLFVNFEIGVLVHSPAEVRAMQIWATKLAACCHPPKPERRRSRLLGNMAEDLSRLLAPLL